MNGIDGNEVEIQRGKQRIKEEWLEKSEKKRQDKENEDKGKIGLTKRAEENLEKRKKIFWLDEKEREKSDSLVIGRSIIQNSNVIFVFWSEYFLLECYWYIW